MPGNFIKNGLWEYRNHKTRQLSGGFKRMLCFAGRYSTNPKNCFCLMNRLVGLDPYARRKMWQMIRNLHQQGLTFNGTHFPIWKKHKCLCSQSGIYRKGCSARGLKLRKTGFYNLTLCGRSF